MAKSPTRKDFEKTLDWLLWWAERQGVWSISVRAGDLHKLVGRYPAPNYHRMPICCSVMRKRMKDKDVILKQPPKGDGANLVITYQIKN